MHSTTDAAQEIITRAAKAVPRHAVLALGGSRPGAVPRRHHPWGPCTASGPAHPLTTDQALQAASTDT